MKKKTLHSTKIKMHIFFQSHNNIRNVKYVKKLVFEFNQKENKGKRVFFLQKNELFYQIINKSYLPFLDIY